MPKPSPLVDRRMSSAASPICGLQAQGGRAGRVVLTGRRLSVERVGESVVVPSRTPCPAAFGSRSEGLYEARLHRSHAIQALPG